MPSPHDPDHTRGASLLLPDEAKETGRPMPDKKALNVKDSRASARFWLGLVALLFGLAVLATGFIFVSAWPGTLAVEVIGAGLAVFAIFVLVLSGVWLSARPRSKKAGIPDASPDLPTPPATTATHPKPEMHPAPTITIEPISTPAAPPVEQAAQTEAHSALAAPSVGETAPPALAETPAAPAREAAPTPGKRTTRAGTGAKPRSARAPANVTEPRLPALTDLPAGLPPSIDRNLIDAEANDLGDLLGDIAEQTVMAMLTRGQRGTQRRERMAAKIEAFRKEMAIDPNYAAVTNFLESIIGLLRAGKIMPASRPLIAPFDGLYDYVLTLIRRKSGTQHD